MSANWINATICGKELAFRLSSSISLLLRSFCFSHADFHIVQLLLPINGRMCECIVHTIEWICHHEIFTITRRFLAGRSTD